MHTNAPAAPLELTFDSAGVTAEGVLHLPSVAGRFPAVVVCQVEPRYGADLAASLGRELARAGTAAFVVGNKTEAVPARRERGAGTGSGHGEATAALSAIALHDNVDASRLGVAGLGQGAAVALRLALEPLRVQAVASVGCPMRVLTDLCSREMLVPKLLLSAENDHDIPAAQFRFLARRYGEPKEVQVIEGAGRYFRGFEKDLARVVASFFQRWLAPAGPAG